MILPTSLLLSFFPYTTLFRSIAPVWSARRNRDLPPKTFYASERFDLVRKMWERYGILLSERCLVIAGRDDRGGSRDGIRPSQGNTPQCFWLELALSTLIYLDL